MTQRDMLQQVLLEQQEEVKGILKSASVKRDRYADAHPHVSKRWIKVIMGIRRSGKSSFAHQLLAGQEYGYVNFDDERLVGMKAHDFNLILQVLHENNLKTKTLLFDEIQNVQGWELFANRLHRQGYNLLITGSNSKLLSKELATHLTGRYTRLEIHPFSFREFLRSKDITWSVSDFSKTENRAALLKEFREYSTLGGFPEMVTDGFEGHYLRELYDKIVSRDIVDRYSIKYGKTLKELALYSFSNLGNRATFQKMKNILELNSVHTVKNYMQYLDDAYLVFLLKSFSFKIKEQIKQPRKIYTIDNGLSRAISPKFTADRGAALENTVFQELMRRSYDISYWPDGESEIDFAIKVDHELSELIQVCYSCEEPSTKQREIKALIRGSEQTGCRNLKILTFDEKYEEKIGKLKVQFVPVWQWLLTDH